MENELIRKIKGGIFGIKQGTKEPKDVAGNLNKLKAINEGQYEDLLKDYKAALASRKD